MRRAWFVTVFAACGGGSGGGKECGPDMPTGVMSAIDSDATVSLQFDDFVASAENVCNDAAAPAGVVSLSIRGTHASGGILEICIPRPDRVEATGDLGGGELELFSADATQDGCTFELSTGASAFGSSNVAGFCDGGTDPAGFRWSANFQAPVRRDCGGTVTTVMLLFNGVLAVAVE